MSTATACHGRPSGRPINLAEVATHQKTTYDKHSISQSFKVGDPVWLSVPTAGKCDHRWEGNWKTTTVKSPITMRRYLMEIERKSPISIACIIPVHTRERKSDYLGYPGLHHRLNIAPPEAPTPLSSRKPSTV